MADEPTYPFQAQLHDLFPALDEAQSSWLAAIDSLPTPDRKTHELIRLVCTVILRIPEGIHRHAMLAREFGATWEEIVGSIMLTTPGFGLLPAVEAMPHARQGFEAAPEVEADLDPDDGDSED